MYKKKHKNVPVAMKMKKPHDQGLEYMNKNAQLMHSFGMQRNQQTGTCKGHYKSFLNFLDFLSATIFLFVFM